MHQVFIEAGLIRKLWNVETRVYRDHLLRLDHESRRNRFCGAIADDPWQSHGVGSALLERTLLSARNRGIKQLQVCCLMENQRMQHLARKFEAEITFDYGSVVGSMENSRPTPLSLIEEMVADGHSFAAACVDFQSSLFKPPRMLGLPLPPAANPIRLYC